MATIDRPNTGNQGGGEEHTLETLPAFLKKALERHAKYEGENNAYKMERVVGIVEEIVGKMKALIPAKHNGNPSDIAADEDYEALFAQAAKIGVKAAVANDETPIGLPENADTGSADELAAYLRSGIANAKKFEETSNVTQWKRQKEFVQQMVDVLNAALVREHGGKKRGTNKALNDDRFDDLFAQAAELRKAKEPVSRRFYSTAKVVSPYKWINAT